MHTGRLGISTRVALLVLACLAFAALLGAPAGAQARPSLGVNVVNPLDPSEVAEAEALGAERVRAFVLVNNVQHAPYAALDGNVARSYQSFVDRLAARNVRVDFVVIGSAGNGAINAPPATPGQYADFVGRFAALFPGKGVSYELWNEPDDSTFWAPSPDPDAYAALVKAAYPAVKRSDRTATVVLGSMTGNNYGFVERLYRLGAKGSFDAVAVHTDTACLVAGPSDFYRENDRIGRYTFLGYKEVRASMLANGDDKPIWMTEFGWSSTNGGPTSCQRGSFAGKKPSGVSEQTQASYLTAAVRCMSADPYLTVATWYTMRDAPGQSIPELRSYGLLRAGGSHKPAYDQMAGLLRGSIAATGACADLQGPAVKILAPTAKQRYRRGPLRIKVAVTDPSGIKGVRFYSSNRKFTSVNKDAVVNAGKPISLRWFGAQCLKRGTHRIKAVAVDKLGNKQFVTVSLKKTTGPKKSRSCRAALRKR